MKLKMKVKSVIRELSILCVLLGYSLGVVGMFYSVFDPRPTIMQLSVCITMGITAISVGVMGWHMTQKDEEGTEGQK